MEQGGMVRFFTKDDRIKLQVNLGAAKNANLDISSKLLRLVDIYPPQKNN
jgi:YfiR/HmsC-like